LLFETGEDEVLSLVTYGKDLIVGTGTNGKTFSWNGTTLSQLPTVPVGAERVMSAWVYANKVYLGYSPGGQVYTYDGSLMQLLLATLETAVTSFATFGSKLYWSTANETIVAGDQLTTTVKRSHKHFVTVPVGTTRLTLLNGTTTVADSHSHAIVNGIVQTSNSHVHGLNGSRSGKIFRYDLATGQPIIVHADTNYAVTCLASTSTTADGILFAGTSPYGKILRYVPEEEIFIKSFQTSNLTVNRLRYYTHMYAMVDNNIYTFNGTNWEFTAANDDVLYDVAPETTSSTTTTANKNILILHGTQIASTSAAPSLLNSTICAYVRFRDYAGNISDIRDTEGNLVECYHPCIDIQTNQNDPNDPNSSPGLKIGKDRIMEVDEDAKVVFGLDGTEPFLSGNKIEQEVAVYYSEVFNGTNSFIQWINLSWVDTIPTGTSITLAVRSADTSSGITNATWSDELTNPTVNDLTNLTGQFLQFRATLKAFQKGVSSPTLKQVNITLRTSDATHYFTTNFVLPDELRKGILTYNGCINPPTTDIVFGVTGLNSTDFSDYYIISPDKVFEVPSEQQTKNLRVGIKFISSPTEVPVVDEFALLVSLANDARIKFNLAGQPSIGGGTIVPTGATRTVLTDTVQGHCHSVQFNSTIVDKTAINGSTSINAGHQHVCIAGILQVSASHAHSFSI